MSRALELRPQYLQQLQKLLGEHAPWAEIWAYGSRVDGTCHEASDLDLVLRNPEELSRPCEKLYELKQAFAESDLPILVEILDWARTPASFRREIEKAHFKLQRPAAETGSLVESNRKSLMNK